MRYYVIHMHGDWTDYIQMSPEQFDEFIADQQKKRDLPNLGNEVILFLAYEGDETTPLPEKLAQSLDECSEKFQPEHIMLNQGSNPAG